MNTKRIISILLAITLLFSIASINVSAADSETYSVKISQAITSKETLDPEKFDYKVNVDENKIYVLENLDETSTDIPTLNYTKEVTSIRATYLDVNGNDYLADYIQDKEAFFAIFEQKEKDVEYVAEFNASTEDTALHKTVKDITLTIEYKIIFNDMRVFGELNTDFVITGFSAPAVSTGLGFADDALGAVKLPKTITISRNIPTFPTIDDVTVESRPKKDTYYDSEKFDATGLELKIVTTYGKEGKFTYSDETAYAFSFNPTNKEKLTTYDKEVIAYLNGREILKTPIVVDHKMTVDENGQPLYVNITTYKYTEAKPGYHAVVCEGCGYTTDAQPHVIDPAAWTYNDDHTFVSNGTETNECLECHTKVIRDAHETAGFNTAFADYHFLTVIFQYINILLNLINGAVQ